MSKWRRAAKIDKNQPGIVEALRAIPGVSVQLGMDDVLAGYKGKTYWYEIKVSAKAEVKDGQKLLAEKWEGHYKIVWSIDMILDDMGITTN
jgi:hypothetical protein